VDFRLNDVNLHATVKHYTDTPCKFNKKENSGMKLTPMESNELFLPEIDKPTKASPFSHKELEVISPPIRRVRTQNSAFDKENQSPNRQFRAATDYQQLSLNPRSHLGQFSLVNQVQNSKREGEHKSVKF